MLGNFLDLNEDFNTIFLIRVSFLWEVEDLDINDIIKRLEIAHSPVKDLKIQEQELIRKEVEYLYKFINKISSFATKKKILGHNCILIFVYENSQNHTISDEVYLSPEGYVTYQVYDELTYKAIVPDATITNGYVVMRVEEFLEHKPLFEIIKFFDKRPSILKKQEYHYSGLNERRREYLKNLGEM